MTSSIICPICDFANAPGADFCSNCGHVLDRATSGTPKPTPPPPPPAYCPHCERLNPADAPFCGHCGKPLKDGHSAVPSDTPAQINCPHCGQANVDDAVFCGNCGRDLQAAPPPSRSCLPWLLLVLGLILAGAVTGYLLLPEVADRLPESIASLLGLVDPTATPRPTATDAPFTAVPTTPPAMPQPTATTPDEPTPTLTHTPRPTVTPIATSTRTPRPTPTHTPTPDPGPERLVIGQTDRDTPIEAVRFGNGPQTLVFIGGMSAGFAPSTVALAEAAVDHFTRNPSQIPDNVTLFIVLSASPDAPLAAGNYRGRLNSNGVDINRNWDCQWATDTRWQGEVKRGSGGTAPFSEAESRALRDLIQDNDAVGVVFWQARADGGLASPGGCGDRVEVSAALAGLYGLTAGYRVENFEDLTRQTLNGDASNWLDSMDIPAVSVLLPNYSSSIDWQNNLAGMLAVLESYAE